MNEICILGSRQIFQNSLCSVWDIVHESSARVHVFQLLCNLNLLVVWSLPLLFYFCLCVFYFSKYYFHTADLFLSSLIKSLTIIACQLWVQHSKRLWCHTATKSWLDDILHLESLNFWSHRPKEDPSKIKKTLTRVLDTALLSNAIRKYWLEWIFQHLRIIKNTIRRHLPRVSVRNVFLHCYLHWATSITKAPYTWSTRQVAY